MSGSGSGSAPEDDEFLLFEDFGDDFEEESKEPLEGWKIFDSGRTQGPSEWTREERDGGLTYVEQRSNIRTRERHSKPSKLGTELAYDAAWEDVSFGTRLRSRDNDMLGLAVRRSSNGKNQIRVSFDRQRRRRNNDQFVRVVELVDGKPTLLASGSWRYKKRRWFDVEVVVVGQRCLVFQEHHHALRHSRDTGGRSRKGCVLRRDRHACDVHGE